MAEVKLEHVYKVYPNGVKAVNDFTMDIRDKEFIVFVGPSGCGKSTTLRMIAGLEDISAGKLFIGGEQVNDAEPKDRDVAMVFQNYALYPHMSVYANMAFGLKLRKLPKEEIDRRVREAAEILGITEYLERKPKALSGGQRQRVALGRAIVREPKVFLLDEPLSNLDAKLRTQMRAEIAKLHQKIQTTFIYVTHDQVEAMTMGTRIVVMKDGCIQQIDTPNNLYNYPCNKFVAGFIGTPQMSFIEGRLAREGDKVKVSFDDTDVAISVPEAMFMKVGDKYFDGRKVVFGIRPEHMSVDPSAFPFATECTVVHVEDLGVESYVYASFCGQDGKAGSADVIIKAPSGCGVAQGDRTGISINMSAISVFDAETEQSAMPRVPVGIEADASVCGGKFKLLGAETELPAAFAKGDGEYVLTVPVGAISFGGDIPAKLTSAEQIDGRTLYVLEAGGKRVFAYGENEEFGGTIGVDFSKCTLRGKDGETVPAVPEYNAIKCRLSRKKNDAGKRVLVAGGGEIECPEEVFRVLAAALGREKFKRDLELRFSPEAFCAGGLPLEGLSVRDYCGRAFADYAMADGTRITLAADGVAAFAPDFSGTGVYLSDPSVRII